MSLQYFALLNNVIQYKSATPQKFNSYSAATHQRKRKWLLQLIGYSYKSHFYVVLR